MQKLHTKYTLTVEVLSPVHVGNGNELLSNYDYAVHNGRTWVIDQEELLAATLSSDGTFNNEWLEYAPASFLKPEDFHSDSPFFHYALPGEPKNRPLREHIKDVWGQPYLPGSTLKGMLRTLLLWGMYVSSDARPDLKKLDGRRSWAAQPLEREMLGSSPNMDLLRALHVSDSTPVEPSRLQVATANVHPTSNSQGSKGLNVDVEALRAGTTLQAEIAIEEYGFRDEEARRNLGWDGLREQLDGLPIYGAAHSEARIRSEDKFHREKGPRSAVGFYRMGLGEQWRNLADNEWLAQIGWGTGWRSKTLDNELTEQSSFMRGVVERYRLGRGRYKSAQEFPKTRNLYKHNGEPAIPMGWVKCRLEEV